MDRRTRRLFLAILLAVSAFGAAFAVLGGGAPGPAGTVAARPDGPSVDGVVIRVDSAGLAKVSGFTLRADDGRTLRFALASLRNGTAFPPGHLGEHQATSQRIRVWYADTGGGQLDALWLEDAPPS